MQCDRCGERLIEIDRYGEQLIGCIECNRWLSSKSAFAVELSPKEIRALRELQKEEEARAEGDRRASCKS
jgi:hypothetical protein